MPFHDFARKTSLLTAIQMSLAVGFSYFLAIKIASLLGFSDPLVSGLWAGISSIVVMQTQIEAVHLAGYLRFIGSLMGAVCAVVSTWLFGYTFLAIVMTMFFTTIMISLLQLKSTLKLSNLTALIIIVVGMMDPLVSPWLNAIARVLESALGAGIAVILVWVFYPIRKKFDLFQIY